MDDSHVTGSFQVTCAGGCQHVAEWYKEVGTDRGLRSQGHARVVFVKPARRRRLGFQNGDMVDLVTYRQGDDHIRRKPTP
jgi:anaerobic selenocysteine-containing dehydrogenase